MLRQLMLTTYIHREIAGINAAHRMNLAVRLNILGQCTSLHYSNWLVILENPTRSVKTSIETRVVLLCDMLR